MFILRGEQQEQGVGKKQLKKVYAIQLIISNYLAPKTTTLKKKADGIFAHWGPHRGDQNAAYSISGSKNPFEVGIEMGDESMSKLYISALFTPKA